MDSAGERKVTPEWYVLGAGAIGGLFAGRLHRGGLNMTLLLRDPVQLADYRTRGLSIAEPDSLSTTAQSCRPGAGLAGHLAPGSIRQLLIATKAHQTQTAVSEIAVALHPEAIIILLQNGMGAGDSIKSLVPRHTIILQAITTEGAWRRSAFELVHAGRGQTWIGSGGAEYPVATAIAQQWRQAGVPTSAEADIAPRLWRKLAVNCAINPFTALYRCRNGELPSHPDWLRRRERVLDEIIALAAVSGYASALNDISREVDQVVAATAENQSSMLQDIRAGHRTEIEFMNGYVAARSRAAGLAAAENQALTEAVAALN